MEIAKEVKGKDIFVAADIGPIGQLLEPMGTLSFDRAYEIKLLSDLSENCKRGREMPFEFERQKIKN